MRLLCQTIAMRANREDGEPGKFWQSRYRVVRLFLSPLETDEHGGEPGAVRQSKRHPLQPQRLLAHLGGGLPGIAGLDRTPDDAGNRGSTPSDAPPILERLKVPPTTWCEFVSNFGRLFSTVAGHPRIVDTTRSRHGHRRFHLPARVRELLPVDP
jgi:hypothetical protein